MFGPVTVYLCWAVVLMLGWGVGGFTEQRLFSGGEHSDHVSWVIKLLQVWSQWSLAPHSIQACGHSHHLSTAVLSSGQCSPELTTAGRLLSHQLTNTTLWCQHTHTCLLRLHSV